MYQVTVSEQYWSIPMQCLTISGNSEQYWSILKNIGIFFSILHFWQYLAKSKNIWQYLAILLVILYHRIKPMLLQKFSFHYFFLHERVLEELSLLKNGNVEKLPLKFGGGWLGKD